MSTDPMNPSDLAPDPNGDAQSIASCLVSDKILYLSRLIAALAAVPAAEPAVEELDLCRAWSDAIDAENASVLPTVGDWSALLQALNAADLAIQDSNAVNGIIKASTNLINTLKAPAD